MGAQLLERDDERRTLNQAVDGLAAGVGFALLLAGPAGIGKSSLLEEAAQRAAAAGVEVLRGSGDELERDLGFGIAGQLLAARSPLAAELAEGEPPEEASALLSLDRVVARLAGRDPLLLAVDDVQWADAPSLRWLVYLARRVGDRRLGLLCARRTGEADPASLLDALAAHSDVLEPQPLSEPAIAELLENVAGQRQGPRVCAAAHKATGGNPFYVRELARMLAQGDVSGETLPTTASEAIQETVLLRIRREGVPAVSVARAVAILAPHAELRHVAAMAGMQMAVAARFLDALASAEVLAPGTPARFVHPIVRAAVLAAMPPLERALAHRTAARLLDTGGAQAEFVGGHLLAAPPSGEAWVVEALRRAARRAAPESAAAFLKRALDEPPLAEDRFAVLVELGRAETVSLSAEAVPHLRVAREEAPSRLERAQATEALAAALGMEDRREECGLILDALIAELQEGAEATAEERELLLRAQATRISEGLASPEELPALRDAAWACRDESERYLLSQVAMWWHGVGTADEAAEMARRAATGPPQGPLGTVAAATALTWADQFDDATRLIDEMLVEARRAEAAGAIVMAYMIQSVVALHRGELARAAEIAAHQRDIATELGLYFGLGDAFGMLALMTYEREGAEATERVLAQPAFEEILKTPRGLGLLGTRSTVRLERRDFQGALEDASAIAAMFVRYGLDHPAVAPIKTSLALALNGVGRRDEALEVVTEEIELARRWGAARPLGIALTTLGRLQSDRDAINALEEAVAVLEPSPARLVRARALFELGAALRRSGQRAASRSPLKQALTLAHACGAGPLEQRIGEELAVIGTRPRSVLDSGLDSLTASERRVAVLAAEGLTNKEIAEQLVISPKTVDNQLSHVYRKLDIRSRRDLPAALEEPSPAQ